MFGNQLLAMFFTSSLPLWFGPLINRRMFLCQVLKLSIMVLLMLALRLFGSDNVWVNSDFLSKPWLFFILKIKVQYGSMIILFNIVRWSMLHFISIIWDSLSRKRLSHLCTIGQMMILLIYLWRLFQKWSSLSFVHCLEFRKIQLWCGVHI